MKPPYIKMAYRNGCTLELDAKSLGGQQYTVQGHFQRILAAKQTNKPYSDNGLFIDPTELIYLIYFPV